MEKLSVGQVVLAEFPFSDLTSKKLRPCLVIGLAEFNDIILCQITSKRYSSKRAVPLRRKDFVSGSIVVDSFVRPDKIVTLSTRKVVDILGRAKPSKLREVQAALARVFKIKETS